MSDPWNSDSEYEWAGDEPLDPAVEQWILGNLDDAVTAVVPENLVAMLRQVAEEYRLWHERGTFISPPDRRHEAMLRLAAGWIQKQVDEYGPYGQDLVDPREIER